MIKKIFLLGFALLAVGQLMMAQSFNMIVLKADGNETQYAVSDVQKIVFDNSTMTVELKSGENVADVTRVSFKDATGVETLKPESSVSVFPNPVQETLTVKGVKKGAVINVFDMSGGLLQTVTTQENTANINVSSLQKGVYLLQVDKQVVKFIKK